MANTIRIKRRANGGGAGAPTTLANAEMAFNEQTNILYYGTGTGGSGGSATSIIPIAGNGAFVDVSTNQTIGGVKTFSSPVAADITGNAATATSATTAGTATQANQLTTARTISVSSDATGSASFDGSANADIALTLATVNSNVGAFTKITVNAKGLATAASQASLTDLAAPTANFSMNGFTLSNLPEPVNPQDAATKNYVDGIAQGLHVHASCEAGTTASLASITGGTVTYNNGASGVGATLTFSNPLTVLDGVTLSPGFRILVKNESNLANNGIYVYTSSTVLTRASDFDTAAEIAGGDFTFVSGGTVLDNTGWVQTEPCNVIGTDPIEFVQFSGAGTYTAGTGLTLTGNQFSITNTAVTAATYGNVNGTQTVVFTVNAQGQLTAAATYDINVDGGTY
jgi:hypothetical protein